MTRQYIYHIYSLSDPRDGKVRYIGCTTNIGVRYRRHFRETDNPRKLEWIQGLVSEGLKPLIDVLEVTTDKYKAADLEKFYYQQHKSEDLLGKPILGIGYANAGTMNDKRIHELTINVSDNTLEMIRQLCPNRDLRRAEPIISRLILDEYFRVRKEKPKVTND